MNNPEVKSDVKLSEVKIDIRCPYCEEQKTIKINFELLISLKSKPLVALELEKGVCCKNHGFIAYIDRNYKVRSYGKIDLILGTKKVEGVKELYLDYSEADLDVIYLNLKSPILQRLLKCVLFKKRIVLILQDQYERVTEYIRRFLSEIFKDKFKYDLTIILDSHYKKEKKKFKVHQFITLEEDSKENKNKFFADLRIEEKIAEKFYMKGESIKQQFRNLANEINTLYYIINEILQLHNECIISNEVLYLFTLKDKLLKRLNTDFDIRYLQYLIDIIINYFKIDFQFEENPGGDFLRSL